MASLSESQTTFPSDSENYDANHSNQDSSSDDQQPSSSSSPSPLILYSPPTIWSILRGAAINILLPFVNGLMLGFGELFAHEAAYRLGWANTKVSGACCGLDRVAKLLRHGVEKWTVLMIYRAGLPKLEIDRTWCGSTRRSHRAETERRRGDGCLDFARIDCPRRLSFVCVETQDVYIHNRPATFRHRSRVALGKDWRSVRRSHLWGSTA